jgi:Pentapeptide repeats (8 copies)
MDPVRIDGIYVLERIAKNSPVDRNAIQHLLGAFVGNNASWPVGAPDGPRHPTAAVDEPLTWMTVQAPIFRRLVSILGRLPSSADAKMLYLSRTDLRGLQLDAAKLTGVQIRHTNLARAFLQGTRLDGYDLQDTDPRRADLEHVRLTGADLSRAYLQDADLRHADLRQVDLRGTNLTGAILDGTALTGAHADNATAWPADLDAEKSRELGIIETSNESPGQMPNRAQ